MKGMLPVDLASGGNSKVTHEAGLKSGLAVAVGTT